MASCSDGQALGVLQPSDDLIRQPMIVPVKH